MHPLSPFIPRMGPAGFSILTGQDRSASDKTKTKPYDFADKATFNPSGGRCRNTQKQAHL